MSDVTSGSKKGRIGHHNDCFLRNPSDMGTYLDQSVERPYLAQETLVLPNGGETCGLSDDNGVPTNRSECPTALQELSDYHFTFLNQNYHQGVLQSWKNGGCWEEVKTKLGYSLRLKEADLPTSVPVGGVLDYSFTITNTGWAAPYRQYTVLLVLKSTSGVYYAVPLDTDPRTWSAGNDHVIQGSVKVHSSTAEGLYEMYMGLVQMGLSERADHYILLTNTGAPRPLTGLNSLLHDLNITGSVETTTTLATLDVWSPPVHPGSRACTRVPIPNQSFETQSDWSDVGQGWTSVSSQAQDGGRSAKVTNGGAYQEFHFSTIRKLAVSGYSKNVGGPASIANPADYSLYCDLEETSGTMLWGYITPFTLGNSSWHKAILNIDLPQSQAIVMARCHLLYRNTGQGEAYFDDIKAYTLSDDVTDSNQCPI